MDIPILMILVTAAFVQAVFGIGGTTLNMTGFPKINLINTGIACGLNVSLNIILIPKMGGNGCCFCHTYYSRFYWSYQGISKLEIIGAHTL